MNLGCQTLLESLYYSLKVKESILSVIVIQEIIAMWDAKETLETFYSLHVCIR